MSQRNSRLGLLLCCWLLPLAESHAVDNLYFYGHLVNEPCTINEENQNIELDFDAIPAKNLYDYNRTQGYPFTITLSDCDLSLATLVNIRFNGAENSALPGLLEIASNPQGAGFAIGLETTDRKPIKLNSLDAEQRLLQEGENQFRFHAYIQGEPEAITNKTIDIGPFNAVVTFMLDYE